MAASMRRHLRCVLHSSNFPVFRQHFALTNRSTSLISSKKETPLNFIPGCLHVARYHCVRCGQSESWAGFSTFSPGLRSTVQLQVLSSQVLQRRFATGGELNAADIKSRVDDIAEKFTEARDLLEDAREVKGTTYFSEDMQEATEAVEETLNDYKLLLSQLNEKQKQDVLRTIGLKMEELKAHKNMLEEEMND